MEINVRGLYKSFDDLEVLRGIDLKIEAGKITVIIGGSGTGKSVFLKHLIGLVRPDAGQIQVDGTDITQLRESELMDVRRRFGMLFQGGALLASLPVGENVALGVVENGLASRREAADQARQKLALVGMEENFDDWPEDLSGGMRKRAALARALMMDPDCILYDEPTAGLDPPRARQIEELILDVARKTGATSVIVTHDMDTVRRIADRVYMLDEGRVVFSGAPDELAASDHPRVREFIER